MKLESYTPFSGRFSKSEFSPNFGFSQQSLSQSTVITRADPTRSPDRVTRPCHPTVSPDRVTLPCHPTVSPDRVTRPCHPTVSPDPVTRPFLERFTV
ncbi:hypothetical protein EVAR_58043_1 [Eumeta japonica]|uniref:Uncharacterized protein n=1 Tax=Eumeta variegata TaxID=151549 RepID=A0A4C1Z3L5_EUMVA|nr:hypothetical protein EVAR_58043_1 [Eumeta japonica]